MAGYTKLFSDIVHSTVWREDVYTKIVWITMLAMSDKHGLVMTSIPGLADMAKVTLPQCVEAINVLSSPDPYSRTKDYEGRRISETDGGWLLLNHEKFRLRKDDEEQRLATAERVRRHRAREAEKSANVTKSVTVTLGNAPLPHTDTDTDTDTKANAEAKPDIKSKDKSKDKDLSPPSASTSKNGTRLPTDWVLPKDWGDWALSIRPELTHADVRLMADTFKDYWLANANRATGKKADWMATWRNWVRNQKQKQSTKFQTADERRMASTDKAIADWLNESSIIEGEKDA